jgi:hypothetical protein
MLLSINYKICDSKISKGIASNYIDPKTMLRRPNYICEQ